MTTTVAASSSGAGGGDEPFEARFEWTPCALRQGGVPGTAECAAVEVPLRWEEPRGPTIELFLKRAPAAVQPATSQIWFLAGGPGQASEGFDEVAAILSDRASDVDFYLLDHRGVGRSTRLECPAATQASSPGTFAIVDEEADACIEELQATWGEDLQAFRTTEAARDVGELIGALREPEQSVALWGGSYGSHWAHRYLQLYPEQADRVLLTALAVNPDLSGIEAWMDDAVGRYLDGCTGVETCTARLGDARALAEDAMTEPAFCPELDALGITPAALKPIFGQLMYQFNERKLIPVLLQRVTRCNEADQRALEHFANLFSGPATSTVGTDLWGWVLADHIMLSELWGSDAPSTAELEAFAEGAIATQGLALRLSAFADRWPVYAPDAWQDRIDPPRVDTFIVHGEFDFIGPDVYQPRVEALTAGDAEVSFTLMPTSPHAIVAGDTQLQNCGFNLLAHYLLTGERTLPCLDELLPLEFAVPASLGELYFGAPNAWDGDPAAATVKSTPVDPEALRGLERLRRGLARVGWHRPAAAR